VELRHAIAVITGASSGIGRATAIEFARHGTHVVVAARRVEKLEELATEIRALGRRALVVGCDVAEWPQVQALAERTKAEFGRADVLVNNAGVPGGGPFDRISIEDAERVTRVNYLGVLYGTKAFLPMMLEAGRGHVVNVASLAGRFAVPGSSVYSATKHAVVAFSESLYYTMKSRGVLVTAVNPGFVRTERFPHNDLPSALVMEPERIAQAIVRVVKTGKGPEVSVPRWVGSLQAVRLLAPPLYRAAMSRAASRGLRPTPVDSDSCG
jgi:short-subunit dehydrogenase